MCLFDKIGVVYAVTELVSSTKSALHVNFEQA